MSEKSPLLAPGDWPDVRLLGFAGRAPLAAAWAWLDAQPAAGSPELLAPMMAVGRVLAAAVAGGAAIPPASRAAIDGYAVHAADCDGAHAYNPLMLELRERGEGPLPRGVASPIAAGWALPAGADAVLPFEAAERDGMRRLDVLAPVAVGAGVQQDGPWAGRLVLQRGQTLLPQHVAALTMLGQATVAVLPRPAVRLIVPGAKWGADALTPMLLGLLARDGAEVETAPVSGDRECDLAAALRPAGPAIVIIAGRSGAGPDDAAAASVWASGGRLALHGLALQPGGSAGLGTLAGAAVVLLPGEPFACLAAYAMLAGRLVRRLAGAGTALPYAAAPVVLDRKIVSGIGVTDVVPVQVRGGRAKPFGIDARLDSLLADGFVVVPETSEGHPAGATVAAHLYPTAGSASGS